MVKIATFDVIPVEGIMEDLQSWFDIEEDGHLLQQNFHEFDYNSTNPVDNLEVIFLSFVLLVVLPIFFKILETVFKCCDKIAKPLNRFKTKVIYWNLYLRFFLEAFLELSIVSLLRLRFIKATTLTETVLSIYAVFILVMLSGYMGGIVPFLRYKHELIDTDYFKDRFGALTLGL